MWPLRLDFSPDLLCRAGPFATLTIGGGQWVPQPLEGQQCACLEVLTVVRGVDGK